MANSKSRQWLDDKSLESMRDMLIVEKQLHEIARQLYQKRGYPFNIKELKTALHSIIQGIFYQSRQLIIEPDPRFKFIFAFPVIYPFSSDLEVVCAEFKKRGWFVSELLNSGHFTGWQRFVHDQRRMVVICQLQEALKVDTAREFVRKQRGEFTGPHGLALAWRQGGDYFFSPEDKDGNVRSERFFGLDEREYLHKMGESYFLPSLIFFDLDNKADNAEYVTRFDIRPDSHLLEEGDHIVFFVNTSECQPA